MATATKRAGRKSVGKKIIEGLKGFADDLKSGKPIKATRLKKVTVNGVPAYVREEVQLRAKTADSTRRSTGGRAPTKTVRFSTVNCWRSSTNTAAFLNSR